ncbi:MAG: hypothetical protein Q7S27_02145 [Nanoarchaeota archaeon]|nr:hypothetical protein [Nanoarchaeota archaeon]
MNKKGIWRVLEAVISVLLIIGALFAVISNKEVDSQQSHYFKELRPFLDEIAQDEIMRIKIITDDDASRITEDELIVLLKNRLPSANLEFNASICKITDSDCLSDNYYPENVDGEVYVEERLISSTLNEYKPSVVRVYVWEK